MQIIKYKFSGIFIGKDCVREYFRNARVTTGAATVITDSNVAKYHLKSLARTLKPHFRLRVITLPAGEKTKTLKTASLIYNRLLRISNGKPHMRSEPVIAFGGGMTGDLAGFAAATYMRGTPLLQIPTSLIGQVDSGIGGKVAVNMPHGKNLIGTFYQPAAILIDPSYLQTLPEREFISGFGEVIKYAVISSPPLFAFLEKNRRELLQRDMRTLAKVISQCVKIKAGIVEQDEKDTKGIRAKLNFGHTYGHAIETLSGYGRYLHGEAVSIGMLKASAIAVQKGICTQKTFLKIKDLMESFHLPVKFPHNIPPRKITGILFSDKKTVRNKPTFVLPVRIGKVIVTG